MAKRRILFLPLWLFLMLVIGGIGLYFGFRTPEIVAGLAVVTGLIAGVSSFVARAE